MTYTLNLPLPPSLNDYYGHHCKFRHATIYIKPKGKEYRLLVENYVLKNNLQLMANIPLNISMTVNPKRQGIWDLDNRLKCALDALTHAKVWQDDSFIHKLTVEKGILSKTNPGILLEINKYEKGK